MAKILVVEDSLYQRKNVLSHLSGWGHEVDQAENGSVGLEKVESFNPDLILSDLLMPVMDGFQLLEELGTRGVSIPVIILSADIQETIREKCTGLGAKAFLSKPVQKDQLEETIKKVLTN